MSKTCNRCCTHKLDTEFYKSTSTNDGLHAWCKECCIERAKSKYEKVHSIQCQDCNKLKSIGSFPEDSSICHICTRAEEDLQQRKVALKEKLASPAPRPAPTKVKKVNLGTRRRSELKGVQYLYEHCIKCDTKKHYHQFNKQRGTHNGLRSWCKECEVVSKVKICIKCGEEKPLEDYGDSVNSYDKRMSSCQECVNERQRKRLKKIKGDKYNPRKNQRVYNNPEKQERMCTGLCGEIKPYSEFGMSNTAKGGVLPMCRICLNLKARRDRGDGKKKYERGLVIDTDHPWYALDINDILNTKQIISNREVTIKIDHKTTLYLPLGCNYKERVRRYIDKAIAKENTRNEASINL